MTTTYCSRNDIAGIIGEPAILACIDDNRNGAEDGQESTYVTMAIERAANEINQFVRYQYPDLTQLASNTWIKWCNAYLAAYQLFARRGNAPPGSVVEAVVSYREELVEIRWGRSQIPEQAPQYDYSPAVSNPSIELNNPVGPVVIDQTLSTSNDPPSEVKRNNANSW